MELRVVTYNVHGFRSGVGSVAAALAPYRPDLALLQECGTPRAIARFARELGLEAASSSRPFNRVRNAVLFGPPWRRLAVHVGDFTREGGRRRRGFVAVHLAGPLARLTAVSAHLGLFPRERQQHARELTDHLASLDEPVVLGGDLNERPDAPAARWITARLFDAFGEAGEGPGETFPARAPTARIDYLFVRGDLRVARAWVPQEEEMGRASDHRPVIAELELPP